MSGTDTSLGTARLDIAVNLTDYEASINRAKNLSDGLGKAAEEAFASSAGQSKKAATQLLTYAETIGKTNDELRLFKAAQKGVETPLLSAVDTKIKSIRENLAKAAVETERAARQDAFVKSVERQAAAIGKTKSELLALEAAELGLTARLAPQIAALKAQENALFGTTTKLNQYGLSTKQVAAAMRGVPAQITDIAVSLQGGQNPLTVLLQQGGQLKDLFGGIVPAAKALASQLLALVNPYTVTAAAVGTLALAWLQADKEARAFADTIDLAGPNFGETEQGLIKTTVALTNLGVSSGVAREAVLAVAASGKFTADQIEAVAKSTVLFQQATGAAIDETIADFAKLSKDPVRGIVELDEKYNFLTRSVYEQIRALKEQGQEQEAVALAVKTFSEVVDSRSQGVIENVNGMTSAWRSLKLVVLDSWDAIKFAVSDTSEIQNAARDLVTARKQLARLESDVAARQSGTAVGRVDLFNIGFQKQQIVELKQEIAGLEKQLADDPLKAKAIAAQNLDRANDIAISLSQSVDKYRSAEQRKLIEIKQIRAQANEGIRKAIAAGDKELAAQIERDAITALKGIPGKKKQDRSARGFEAAVNKADLQEFKNLLLEEQAAIQNSTRVLQAEYAARLVTTEQFYAESKKLVQQDLAAQERAILGQIEVLQARNIAGKDSVNNQRELGELEAKLTKIRLDGETALKILSIQEQDRARKQQEAIDAYKVALDSSTLALRQQYDAKVLRLSLSDQEFEKQQEINSITAEYTKELEKLNRELNQGAIDKAKYDAEKEALKKAVDERVKIVEDGYKRMGAAQDDWLQGVRNGIKNWVDEAGKVAQQSAAITQRAMDTITDALVNAAITGKLAWKDMLADILKQIAAFLIKQAVLAFINLILNAFGVGSAEGDTGSSGGTVGTGPDFKSAAVAPTTAIVSGGKSAMMQPIPAASNGKMMVSGEPTAVSVNINTTINSNGNGNENQSSRTQNDSAFVEFAQRMRNIANQEIQNAMRPGGSLWKAGVSTR